MRRGSVALKRGIARTCRESLSRIAEIVSDCRRTGESSALVPLAVARRHEPLDLRDEAHPAGGASIVIRIDAVAISVRDIMDDIFLAVPIQKQRRIFPFLTFGKGGVRSG